MRVAPTILLTDEQRLELGAAAASRTAAQRSASARKAAATRKRNAEERS